MVYTTPRDVAAHTQAPAAGFVVVEFVFNADVSIAHEHFERVFLALLRIGGLVLGDGPESVGRARLCLGGGCYASCI